MYKLLSVFILLSFPSILYAQPQVQILNISDNSVITDTVCQDTHIKLVSAFQKPNIKQFNWNIDGKNVYGNNEYLINTSDYLGTISIISEVVYIEKKQRKIGKNLEWCEIECHAWARMSLNVVPCKKPRTCPQIPNLKIKASDDVVDGNSKIVLTAETDYPEEYSILWFADGGSLDKLSANSILFSPMKSLITETIEVRAVLHTNYGEKCMQNAVFYLKSVKPIPQERVKIMQCDMKNSRIDNVCKARMKDLIDTFHSVDAKTITIVYSDKVAALAAQKVLTNGSLGVSLDTYRITLEFDPKVYKTLKFLLKY